MEPQFGTMVHCYEEGRKGYPEEVVDFCLAGLHSPLLLDLGCGTGIATRQLANRGIRAIGADLDPLMLEAASDHEPNGALPYVCATAETLPFKNNAFDVITAFGAFHWFANAVAVREIKRVLKPGGAFFRISKGNFVKPILEEIVQRTLLSSIDSPTQIKVLLEGGFRLEVKIFKVAESYTLSEFLAYARSTGLWPCVADDSARVISCLRRYFSYRAENGVLKNQRDIAVLKATMKTE